MRNKCTLESSLYQFLKHPAKTTPRIFDLQYSRGCMRCAAHLHTLETDNDRTRYDANFERELPRIAFPPDIHAFVAADNRLMDLHIDCEK